MLCLLLILLLAIRKSILDNIVSLLKQNPPLSLYSALNLLLNLEDKDYCALYVGLLTANNGGQNMSPAGKAVLMNWKLYDHIIQLIGGCVGEKRY